MPQLCATADMADFKLHSTTNWHKLNIGADNNQNGGIEIGVGKGQVVEFKSGGTTPTIALIERLDINVDRNGKKDGLYEDSVESIIYEMHYEEFEKEVKEALAALSINFDKKVVNNKKCKPEEFLNIINNL